MATTRVDQLPLASAFTGTELMLIEQSGILSNTVLSTLIAYIQANVTANPSGTIIDYSGTSAPSGYIACPTTQTNISRTTYATLFTAIGTTWGVGDGSTTFGMPWFPAGYVSGQGTVAVQSVGSVIAHTHPYTSTTVNTGVASANDGPQSVLATTANTTGSTGGSANFAAIVGVLKCVKL